MILSFYRSPEKILLKSLSLSFQLMTVFSSGAVLWMAIWSPEIEGMQNEIGLTSYIALK